MGQFDLDFSLVRNVVAPPDRLPVMGNEHRMVCVAFDLFRLDGDQEERLWQVQTAEDGAEFLVRTYDLPEDDEDSLESRSTDWSVMTDSKFANLTIAYKRVPVHRLAAADYGASEPDQVRLLRDLVSEKLATDKAWAGRLLRDLPPAKLAVLGEAFPELSKFAVDVHGDEPSPLCPKCGCTHKKKSNDADDSMSEREEERQRFRSHQQDDMRKEKISRMWGSLSDETRDRVVPGWKELRTWNDLLERLRSEEALQVLKEMAGEAGYQAPEEHGYSEEIEHFDSTSADDMLKLASMALAFRLNWIDQEMQYTEANLKERVEESLKMGLKVVRVSRGGAPPPKGSIWYYKSIGMGRAADSQTPDKTTPSRRSE